MSRFLSVAVVFAAGLVLAPVVVRGGEDEDVQRFLARLGLVDLQILQLEKAIQKDLPAEPRKKLAQRLADLYAGRLVAVSDEPEKYEAVLKSIKSLVARVPEANTTALKVMLLQADYARAEALIGRWIADPRDDDARQQARKILAIIAPKLDEFQRQLNEEVEALTEQIDELDEGDLRDTKEKELSQKQAVAGRATYFAGWSNYYLGLTAEEEATLTTARSIFRKLLGIGDDETYADVDVEWLALESVYRSRAVIGLGLAEAAAGDIEASRQCFKLLEAPGVPPVVRDQASYWFLQGLINAGRLDEAAQYARSQIDTFTGTATQGKVSLCVALIRSGFGSQREGAQLSEEDRAIGMLGIAGLAKLRQFVSIRRLMSQYDVKLDGNSGFFLTWLGGQQRFSEAEKSKNAEDYRAAAKLLLKALADPKAERELSSAGQARYTLGWCQYRLGEFRVAGRQFEQAVTGLKASDGDLAVEAAWMAFASYHQLAKKDSHAAHLAITALESIKRDFPHHTYAKKADYLIAKLEQGAAAPEESIRRLTLIKPDDPDYLLARLELCSLLHRQWTKARGTPQEPAAAAKVRQAVDFFLDAAKNDAGHGRKLRCVLIVVAEALGGKPADKETASSYLAKAASWVPSLPESHSSVAEFHYRSLQLARVQNNDRARQQHAQWLVQNAAGSVYETPALIVAAKAIETSIQKAEGEQLENLQAEAHDVYRRLVQLLGDSKDVISSQKNARVAISRMAHYAHKCGQYAEAADRLERLLAVYPKDKGYLRRCGEAHFLAGSYKASLPYWRTLLSGLSSGSQEWYQAKYHLLACLAHTDKPIARKALRQFKLLHPQMGNDDKFRALEPLIFR